MIQLVLLNKISQKNSNNRKTDTVGGSKESEY